MVGLILAEIWPMTALVRVAQTSPAVKLKRLTKGGKGYAVSD